VRVHLEKGRTAKLTIEVPADRFRYWDTVKKDYVVEPGKYELLVGAASDDIREKLPFQIIAAN
jgi:beta-glucosidase